MATLYTQTEFDGKLETLFLNQIRYADMVAALHRQSDPESRNKEEYLMMFSNILYALRDYDVTSELMPDSEIDYLFELGTQLSLNWLM